MILHWILAYRSSITCYVSVITLYFQHFTILFSNHLFTSTPYPTIPILHSPTLLAFWALSPSAIYNTVWRFCRYLLDTSWFSIINIALQQPLFHRFCTHSCLFHPLPSLPFILRPSSHFGLLAPAPLIILSYQSYTTSWTSVGDSSPTSCSNTTLFYSQTFYLHIFYSSLSLLTTFRPSSQNGLLAQAPSIIQYEHSLGTSQTSVGDSSPTSLSNTLHSISKHSIYTYSIHLLHFYPLPTAIPALGLLTPSTFRILP